MAAQLINLDPEMPENFKEKWRQGAITHDTNWLERALRKTIIIMSLNRQGKRKEGRNLQTSRPTCCYSGHVLDSADADHGAASIEADVHIDDLDFCPRSGCCALVAERCRAKGRSSQNSCLRCSSRSVCRNERDGLSVSEFMPRRTKAF
jgi:hypothetical protein